MEKKELENNIKKSYKAIQNYLKGDPGAEGFLDSLTDLEINFAEYLITVLEAKKYGKNDVTNSNIYQGHIKGGDNSKYIDNVRLEHIVSNKVLGKKVSITSLMDEGIQRLKELFDTQESFKEALENGIIQNIHLNSTILPPDDLSTPIIGSGKGFEKKESGQNKLRLFISILRELGIYDDDLIVYSGTTTNNMMRESSYYAIFIPRINKTVFLNTGYGEATFVCEGEVSIQNMTTLGKEKLQNELGAKKIKFFENDINGWKKEIKDSLLSKGSNVGKKINIKKITNKINKDVHLYKIKTFYEKHKNDTFTDTNGNESTIEALFFGTQYYSQNYKIINDNPNFDITLPADPGRFFNIKWANFQEKIGVITTATIQDVKSFYEEHKDDTFKDMNGNEATIAMLFKSSKYYEENYKIINDNPELKIKLPAHPDDTYHMKWTDFQKKLGIIRMSTIQDVKEFYEKHKNHGFIDANGNKSTIKKLFSKLRYYQTNYKIINDDPNFDIILPKSTYDTYNMKRTDFQRELGIKIKEKISPIQDVKQFYMEHENDTINDANGKETTIKNLFSKLKYYQANHQIINNDPRFNIVLPVSPHDTYDMKRSDFQKELGVKTKEI